MGGDVGARSAMMLYLWIGLGSALGGVLRFALVEKLTAAWGHAFPWGTLCVNVTGSLVMGALAGLVAAGGPWEAAPSARHFLMTGVLGGYTTFSAFSLQTLELARAGAWGRAAGYVAASIVVCLVAVTVGYLLVGTLRK